MPSIRISKLTWERLVGMKSGMDSLDTVVRRLITAYDIVDISRRSLEDARKIMEAQGEKSSPSAWRETHKRAREIKP